MNRRKDEIVHDPPTELGHEKLRVYQLGLEHVTWMHSQISNIEVSPVVLDHWSRAAESVIENIANGNSRRSRTDRNRYFDVAFGSALECAACLDICYRKKMISDNQLLTGKQNLQQIVKMTIGLRWARSPYVREPCALYDSGQSEGFFPHENLKAYKVALDLVSWLHGFLDCTEVSSTHLNKLDKASTSLVLNIAEGNGRFSDAEQRHFLDIAHTSAMRIAACLDVLVERHPSLRSDIIMGKRILTRLVPLVLGLRGYLEENEAR